MQVDMLEITTGNILESNADALVNTVNLEGFMGKGIAYQFKKEYPNNNEAYIKACKTKEIAIGKVFVFYEKDKYIINFPTKDKWRENSQYSYIESGMKSLIENIIEYDIKSIAIPPLGCGNGGLEWFKVKEIIESNLTQLTNTVYIKIYAPSKYFSSKAIKAPQLNASHIILMILKTKLKKFSKIRLQKSAFILNISSGNKYFRFSEYKFGPYSHSIDVLGRDIKEYQEFYKLTTEKAVDHLYNNIISKSVNEKIEIFKKPIDKASEIINSITSDKELEIITTILWIVDNKPIASVDELIDEYMEWPKKSIERFQKNELINCFEKMLISEMIIKSLMSYEINKNYFIINV